MARTAKTTPHFPYAQDKTLKPCILAKPHATPPCATPLHRFFGSRCFTAHAAECKFSMPRQSVANELLQWCKKHALANGKESANNRRPSHLRLGIETPPNHLLNKLIKTVTRQLHDCRSHAQPSSTVGPRSHDAYRHCVPNHGYTCVGLAIHCGTVDAQCLTTTVQTRLLLETGTSRYTC